MMPSYRRPGEGTPATRSLKAAIQEHNRRLPAYIRPIPATPTECPQPRRARNELWVACWQGRMPAEALPTKDREDLVYHLHAAGWSDVQIALHTSMTVYTTVRIRERLEMPANPARLEDIA